jgi:hypothetical protein
MAMAFPHHAAQEKTQGLGSAENRLSGVRAF